MTLPRIPNIVWPRNFKDWSGPAAIEAFGLVLTPEHPEFRRWSSQRSEWPAEYSGQIERMRLELQLYYASWNEIELMMNFVGPYIKLIAFGGRRYGLFFGRKMQVDLGGLKVGGTVDGMLALGFDDPVQPFFFLKEYKKSQGYDNDPFGQLLISMIAAQELNNDGQPLYGCYVIGKYWTFVLLAGDQYAVSQGYDATDAGELQIIWSMLVEVKLIVEERVERLLAQAE